MTAQQTPPYPSHWEADVLLRDGRTAHIRPIRSADKDLLVDFYDHRVSDDRVHWRYLLRRGWAEGLSKAAVSRAVGTGDSLSAESSYTMKVLPAGVVREVRERNPVSAAAIVACFGVTAAGYLRGRLPGATSEVRMPVADGSAPGSAPRAGA